MGSNKFTRSGLAALAAVSLALLGCGEADPLEDADPRCAALCTIEEPPIEGALDICNIESAYACIDQCAVRIEEVAPLCATCLLERARFGVPRGEEPLLYCSTTTCWAQNGDGEQCQYARGDGRAEEDCIRQLYPRREVACTAEWRPVVECAEACD